MHHGFAKMWLGFTFDYGMGVHKADLQKTEKTFANTLQKQCKKDGCLEQFHSLQYQAATIC